MTLRPCRWAGCSALVERRYCIEHSPRVEAQIQRGRRHDPAYATKRWHATRRAVLRDQPLCPGVPTTVVDRALFGYSAECGALTVEVDHIVPVEDGGEMWDRANLQALCRRCHSRKTARDVSGRVFH